MVLVVRTRLPENMPPKFLNELIYKRNLEKHIFRKTSYLILKKIIFKVKNYEKKLFNKLFIVKKKIIAQLKQI